MQVYEETAGLSLGEPCEGTGARCASRSRRALSAIFLTVSNVLWTRFGTNTGFIPEGLGLQQLSTETAQELKFTCQVGDELQAGSVYGEVQETGVSFTACPCRRSFRTVTELLKLRQRLTRPVLASERRRG